MALKSPSSIKCRRTQTQASPDTHQSITDWKYQWLFVAILFRHFLLAQGLSKSLFQFGDSGLTYLSDSNQCMSPLCHQLGKVFVSAISRNLVMCSLTLRHCLKSALLWMSKSCWKYKQMKLIKKSFQILHVVCQKNKINNCTNIREVTFSHTGKGHFNTWPDQDWQLKTD